MCEACFLGKPVSVEELAGESGDSRDRENHRRYYLANHKKCLDARRRWRSPNASGCFRRPYAVIGGRKEAEDCQRHPDSRADGFAESDLTSGRRLVWNGTAVLEEGVRTSEFL
jgi:hypothetical protein